MNFRGLEIGDYFASDGQTQTQPLSIHCSNFLYWSELLTEAILLSVHLYNTLKLLQNIKGKWSPNWVIFGDSPRGGRRGQRPLGESPGFPNTVPQVQKQRFKSLNPDAWDVSHAEFVHHLTYQVWVTCICTAPIHLNSIKFLERKPIQKIYFLICLFGIEVCMYWWSLDFWGTLGSGSCS